MFISILGGRYTIDMHLDIILSSSFCNILDFITWCYMIFYMTIVTCLFTVQEINKKEKEKKQKKIKSKKLDKRKIKSK